MRIKKVTQKALLTNLFFILFFLIIPALAFVRRPGENLFTVNKVIVQDTLANFILLCFFYLNYYIFIPKFYFTRRYIIYILLIILFLSITFPLSHLIVNLFPNIDNSGLPPFDLQHANIFPLRSKVLDVDKTFEQQPLFQFSFVEFRRHLYLFFTAVFFSFLLRTREHLSQLKEEKLNAELASLKSQINPHFLFNTLNNIYSLSLKKNDKASDAIIHLAGIMRYAISDANGVTIPLEKEIDYLINYIELQKSRLENTACIFFEITGEAGNKSIAPLILITYVENAFKYGISPDADDCRIEITLQIVDTEIRLHTFNNIVRRSSHVESTGIGMNNTRNRLLHLYPDKHSLQISEDKETYSVTLSIELV